MRSCSKGFTLVELLVALMVMALLSLLSWRGLDAMARTQARTQARADDVRALQTGLGQWGADLDAMADVPDALEWSGQSLRILRYSSVSSASGLQVVAWSRREIDGVPQWLRWQSDVLQTRPAIRDAWLQAGLWAQNPNQESRRREVAIVPLAQWQIFFYRGDAWTNPSSSSGATPKLPDGVRLVLTLPPGGAVPGVLTRDWIHPAAAPARS
jgi:general secretion pathway protein J